MALESYNQSNTPFAAESLPFILTVIDGLEEPVFVKNEQHRFVLVNDVLCRLIGKTREELLGRSDYDFFPKAQADVFWEQDQLVFESGETRINEEKITWHDEVHTIQTTKQLFTDPATGNRFIVGTIKDLSGRQDTVAALISGWAAMQRVLEETGTVLFEQDLDLRYTRFFSAHKVFRREDYLGKTDFDAHSGTEGNPLIELKQRVIETGEQDQREVSVTAGGKRYYFELFVLPRRDDAGKITGVLCSAIDITREIEVLQELDQSRHRFRTIFSRAPIPVVLARLSGEIVEVNDAMVQFLEFDRDGLERIDRAPFVAHDKAFIDDKTRREIGAGRMGPYEFERHLVTRSGKSVWADVTITGFTDDDSDGVLLVAMLRDVTGQRQLLEQLRRRELILSAVTFVAEQFLARPDFAESVQSSLERLGRATEVSRVYLFRNHLDDQGRQRTSQQAEWISEGIHAEIDNPDMQNLILEGPYEDLRVPLSRGEAVYGAIDEFNPGLQEIYGAQAIRSIVLVPVFVASKWWGIIGFDECRRERRWSDLEIDGLKAAASILGSAIERSEAHQALSNSELRWKSLVENDPDSIVEFDSEGTVLFLNRSQRGFHRDEVIGHNVMEFLAPQHCRMFREAMERARTTGEVASLTINATNVREQSTWWSCRIVQMPGIDGREKFLAVWTDITELTNRQEELTESREQYRTLVENQTELIVKVDREGRFLFASPSYCQTFGLDREKILGTNTFWPLVHPDDVAATEEALAQVIEPPYECSLEQRAKTPDGWRWFEWYDRAFVNDDGEVTEILGVGRDITDRKQFEAALGESEARFRELAETTNAAIFIYQGNDTIYANPAAETITGYSIDELRTMPFWPIIHPDFRDVVEERAKARLTGESDIPSRYEVKIVAKDGTERWIDFTGARISHDGRPAVLGTAFDVTARRNAEEAQKRLTVELRQQRESLQKEKYALERVVDQIEVGKREYKGQIGDAVKRVLGPMLEKLRTAAPAELKIEIDAANDKLDSLLGEGTSVQRMRLSQLTGREWEICRLIQAGESSKEIAASLNLSVMTIHKHRERIRRKLGLTSKSIDLSTFLNLYRDVDDPR